MRRTSSREALPNIEFADAFTQDDIQFVHLQFESKKSTIARISAQKRVALDLPDMVADEQEFQRLTAKLARKVQCQQENLKIFYVISVRSPQVVDVTNSLVHVDDEEVYNKYMRKYRADVARGAIRNVRYSDLMFTDSSMSASGREKHSGPCLQVKASNINIASFQRSVQISHTLQERGKTPFKRVQDDMDTDDSNGIDEELARQDSEPMSPVQQQPLKKAKSKVSRLLNTDPDKLVREVFRIENFHEELAKVGMAQISFDENHPAEYKCLLCKDNKPKKLNKPFNIQNIKLHFQGKHATWLMQQQPKHPWAGNRVASMTLLQFWRGSQEGKGGTQAITTQSNNPSSSIVESSAAVTNMPVMPTPATSTAGALTTLATEDSTGGQVMNVKQFIVEQNQHSADVKMQDIQLESSFDIAALRFNDAVKSGMIARNSIMYEMMSCTLALAYGSIRSTQVAKYFPRLLVFVMALYCIFGKGCINMLQGISGSGLGRHTIILGSLFLQRTNIFKCISERSIRARLPACHPASGLKWHDIYNFLVIAQSLKLMKFDFGSKIIIPICVAIDGMTIKPSLEYSYLLHAMVGAAGGVICAKQVIQTLNSQFNSNMAEYCQQLNYGTEVLEVMFTTLDNVMSLPIGFFLTKGYTREMDFEYYWKEVFPNIIVCKDCLLTYKDVAVAFVKCNLYCAVCQINKSVCSECKKQGETQWSYYLRVCRACRLEGRLCIACAPTFLSTDCQSQQLSFGLTLGYQQQLISNITYTPVLMVFDPPHNLKSLKGGLFNWWRSCGFYLINFRMLTVYCCFLLEQGKKDSSVKAGLPISLRALYNKDRQSVNAACELCAPKLWATLSSIKSFIICTIVPDPILQKAKGHDKVGAPRLVTSDGLRQIIVVADDFEEKDGHRHVVHQRLLTIRLHMPADVTEIGHNLDLTIVESIALVANYVFLLQNGLIFVAQLASRLVFKQIQITQNIQLNALFVFASAIPQALLQFEQLTGGFLTQGGVQLAVFWYNTAQQKIDILSTFNCMEQYQCVSGAVVQEQYIMIAASGSCYAVFSCFISGSIEFNRVIPYGLQASKALSCACSIFGDVIVCLEGQQQLIMGDIREHKSNIGVLGNQRVDGLYNYAVILQASSATFIGRTVLFNDYAAGCIRIISKLAALGYDLQQWWKYATAFQIVSSRRIDELCAVENTNPQIDYAASYRSVTYQSTVALLAEVVSHFDQLEYESGVLADKSETANGPEGCTSSQMRKAIRHNYVQLKRLPEYFQQYGLPASECQAAIDRIVFRAIGESCCENLFALQRTMRIGPVPSFLQYTQVRGMNIFVRVLNLLVPNTISLDATSSIAYQAQQEGLYSCRDDNSGWSILGELKYLTKKALAQQCINTQHPDFDKATFGQEKQMCLKLSQLGVGEKQNTVRTIQRHIPGTAPLVQKFKQVKIDKQFDLLQGGEFAPIDFPDDQNLRQHIESCVDATVQVTFARGAVIAVLAPVSSQENFWLCRILENVRTGPNGELECAPNGSVCKVPLIWFDRVSTNFEGAIYVYQDGRPDYQSPETMICTVRLVELEGNQFLLPYEDEEKVNFRLHHDNDDGIEQSSWQQQSVANIDVVQDVVKQTFDESVYNATIQLGVSKRGRVTRKRVFGS